MFIDRVDINIKAGDGGSGCVSFRREKHVPRGGPDGGDGGDGGDILIRVDRHMRTLLDLRYRKNYKAGNGRPGEGARRTGKSGETVVIRVPPGTVVEDIEEGVVIADLSEHEGEVVAARGGAGGKGNYSFRSPRDQAPRRSTPGAEGERRRLRLVLKLIADVGLVGLPNAGKSTLLGAVSDARPEIAEYPFTTVRPNLAIVGAGGSGSFCMVDIPGLIEGAHEGKGLGLQFLQHIERCRVLLLIIDAAAEIGPAAAYGQLIGELGAYGERLLDLPRLIALNKIDLVSGGQEVGEPVFPGGEAVYRISALTGEGLVRLMAALQDVLSGLDTESGEAPVKRPYDPMTGD